MVVPEVRFALGEASESFEAGGREASRDIAALVDRDPTGNLDTDPENPPNQGMTWNYDKQKWTWGLFS